MPVPEWLAATPEEEWRHWLEDLPFHLVSSGQAERLYTLLTTYDFLQAKVEIVGVEQLIADYALAKKLEANSENGTLQRIADALRAGTPILRKAPEELWNQIKGRANFALHTSHPRSMPRLDLLFATLLPANEALLHILDGHSRTVTSCALSADGKLALSASEDRTLRLWDTASGEMLRVLEEPQSFARSCMLSADGKLAFAISANGTLRLWDTTSRQILHTLESPKGFRTTCGALSANGQRALSGGGTMLLVWDTASAQMLCTLKGHRSDVTDCALSADGRLALSASEDRTLRLWDTESGETLRILRGFIGAVDECAFSEDGRVALSLSRHPILGVLGHSTLRLWDTGSGRKLRTLKGHKSLVTGCALSGDGRLAVTSSAGSFLHLMLGEMFYFGSLLGSLGYFERESRTALRIWDTASGQILHSLKGYGATSCALSREGRLALTATTEDFELGISSSETQMLRLWDTKSKEEGLTQEGHRLPVTACALSANGRLALSASGDRTLRLWDTTNGKTLRVLKDKAPVSCALSGDGRLALTLSEDGTKNGIVRL